jgi:hypothetical protein
MKARTRGMGAVLMYLATSLACSRPAPKVTPSWSPQAAAAYLDYREARTPYRARGIRSIG